MTMSSDHYRDAIEAARKVAFRWRTATTPSPERPWGFRGDALDETYAVEMPRLLDALAHALAQAEEDVKHTKERVVPQSEMNYGGSEPASCVPLAGLVKLRDELAEDEWPARIVNALDSLIASAVPCGEERLRKAATALLQNLDRTGRYSEVTNQALAAIRTALSPQHTEEG